MKKIGFIGTGNMGSALIKGMLKNKVAEADDIIAYDSDVQKLAALAAETGVCMATDNPDVVTRSDIAVLAVKPNVAPGVLESISSVLNADKILISIVLGLTLGRMSALGGGLARYVRCMPNTPALVNEGMTCVASGAGLTEADLRLVGELFGAVGKVEFLTEYELSKVTALTGSSPAYVFLFIEAMADAAVCNGLPRALAYRLASQAVLGSARMALETGMHPGELKDMVCSPAGSTIEAIRVLEAKGFRSAVIEAMRACDLRSDEISRA